MISILVVNYNSSDFISISLYALFRLTKNKYKVYIMDNGSEEVDYLNLVEVCKKYDNVFLERWKTELRGSMAHGTALNYLVNKVKTKYFSILDADAIWLIKNWDEILINKINSKIKLIGTQAPAMKPQDFPLMFAVLFETETFRELNIDFRPKNIQARQDTGFEMRDKYLKAGYLGENINVKNTREYKNGPFAKLLGVAEYYFDENKNIVASHFGRGSTLGANKYIRSNLRLFYSIPVVGMMLLAIKGKKEKKDWIKICKEVINSQK